MEAILGVLALAGFATAGITLFQLSKVNAAKGPLEKASSTKKPNSDLDAARAEISRLKTELSGKTKSLEEVREEARKKARREGKKAAQKDMPEAPKVDDSAEVKKLKAALATLESQITDAAKESQRIAKETEHEVKSRFEKDLEKARGDARKFEETLEDLRSSIKRKQEARPDIPGSGLDLKSLAPDVVQELARYFRKSEDFERMFSVTQGQLQLERDKLADLQKRYYAVCRELAVAASGPSASISDADARRTAENLVSGSDALSAGIKGAQSADRGGPVGEDGEKKKRRRRRRKKRVPGEDGDQASASGADDDGDDGDDGDGDEGDDVGNDAAIASTTPVAADAPAAESAG